MHPSLAQIQARINEAPELFPDGTTWLIGNEIIWDDHRTPVQYAQDYHEFYYGLKAINPTFKIANGSVITSVYYDRPGFTGTPYELLDAIRAAYQSEYGEEWPVDVWNIHPYVWTKPTVQEELADLENQLNTFRDYMVSIGEQDKPLIITEYGLLNDHPEQWMIDFLFGSFDILLSKNHPNGMPSDEGRWVQRWAWFVNNNHVWYEGGPVQWTHCALYNGDTFDIRPLGEAYAAYQSNPYGVSGANWSANGVMVKLGMPPECLCYIWDTLQPTNLVNMVRPKKYWEYVGVNPDRIQGYNSETDQLLHPEEFGQWVEDHPGTIWIIGNEPDMGGQDNLTPEQYARMFHTYYDFIKVQDRDPTARFATAGLAALAYTSWLNDDIAWWDQVLAEYQSQFGTDMPINIWNCHCYAIAGELDPNRVIADYFHPFLDYTRTVNGGIYEDTEFWVTEFGFGGDLGGELGGEYMKQLCPRLEALGVDRFFWFLGPWSNWDPSFQRVALLGPDGLPTALG
ncbi:MAG: hypothetical protein KAY24_19510, partial [Candidatus Eisenbacteria sp.]|nr:hypothetical protein [Candidatus Eisenbacteria bacterium]